MTEEVERLRERLLVLRCQTGDESACRELVEHFSPRLRYFLRKQSPAGDRVDDLLQEVWMDTFRQLARLQDAGAFTAWVYQIARGKVLVESRQRAAGRSVASEMELVASSAVEPEFSAEDAAAVHAMLDQLPLEQREVLVLRFLEDLSYEEIGRIVDCPVGTVRSRIHYGKQALKRLLEKRRSG